jgi:DNA invertase Pin-like site-specific DNA recombinase
MGGRGKRAALYLRVSTDQQTTENQRIALEAVCQQRGWHVVEIYSDNGISGSKGRDKRPALDKMLKDAARGRFDVLMAWSVDRLGRSLQDLLGTLQDLHAARCDLFLHQQGLDTSTAAGRAMFQMMGVFSEFERAMIQSRVLVGLQRAKEKGTKTGNPIGRPKVPGSTEAAIRARLASGVGILKVAREVGVGTGVVQRIRREMDAHRAG